MFLHGYLLAYEISTVRTLALRLRGSVFIKQRLNSALYNYDADHLPMKYMDRVATRLEIRERSGGMFLMKKFREVHEKLSNFREK